MDKQKQIKAKLAKRKVRVRSKVSGTKERPRLCVTKSNSNIYAQVIDDTSANTIVSASSLSDSFSAKGGTVEGAKEVGTLIAKRALDANISEVVFDRGGNLYHGRVKALADAAREGGLKF